MIDVRNLTCCNGDYRRNIQTGVTCFSPADRHVKVRPRSKARQIKSANMNTAVEVYAISGVVAANNTDI